MRLGEERRFKEIFELSAEMEIQLFNRLMRIHGREFEYRIYADLMDIVLREFMDKHHFAFRRKVINKEHNLDIIVRAQGYELMCELSREKKEEQDLIRYRQMQKIEDRPRIIEDDDVVPI